MFSPSPTETIDSLFFSLKSWASFLIASLALHNRLFLLATFDTGNHSGTCYGLTFNYTFSIPVPSIKNPPGVISFAGSFALFFVDSFIVVVCFETCRSDCNPTLSFTEDRSPWSSFNDLGLTVAYILTFSGHNYRFSSELLLRVVSAPWTIVKFILFLLLPFIFGSGTNLSKSIELSSLRPSALNWSTDSFSISTRSVTGTSCRSDYLIYSCPWTL